MKYFVPWLSFDRNLWTDLLIVFVSIFSFLYLKNKGPKEYDEKHIFILSILWTVFVYYWFINHTFIYIGVMVIRIEIPYYLLLLLGLTLGAACAYCQAQKERKEIRDKKKQIVKKYNIQDDSPITEQKDDILRHMEVVNLIISTIKMSDVAQTFSIGITAPWGSGKSSLLNLLKQQIEKDSQFIFIEFNPRGSLKITNIQEDFLNILKDKMKAYHSSFTHYIKSYAKALQLIDEKNPILGWLDFFGLNGAEENKERINGIIKRSERKLIILVDDLDRMTGEEIIEVFKLIDRNASFYNTFFISAYDKEYINCIINEYLKTTTKQVFTDKFFDLEFSLPKCEYTRMLGLLDKLMKEAINSGLIHVENTEMENILAEHKNICEEVLPTIRSIKRFYNKLTMELNLTSENDLVFNDFFLLLLLQYNNPTIYQELLSGKYIERSSNDNNIYQLKEISDANTTNTVWYKILEALFQKGITQPYSINNRYKHIYYTRAFDTYFYGYKFGRLYYKDLAQLLTLPKPQLEVIEAFEKWNSTAEKQDITDFLFSINYDKFNSLEEYKQYIRLLLIYTHVYKKMDINYIIRLCDICKLDAFFKSITNCGVESEAEYKDILTDIFENGEFPLIPSAFLGWLVQSLARKEELVKGVIFDLSEVKNINICNLESAISQINHERNSIKPTNIYDLMSICIDSISQKGTSVLSQKALRIVRESMNNNPAFYAPSMLYYINGSPMWQPNMAFEQLFHENKQFDEFLENLKSVSVREPYPTLVDFWSKYKSNMRS